MFKCLNKRKGQSTLEYAVLIVIVIAALLAMNQYIKRGIQGRLKSATDDVGDQFSSGNTNYVKNVVTGSHTNETFVAGSQKTLLLNTEATNTTENTVIHNTQQEYYGR